MLFKNRDEAAKLLAEKLQAYRGRCPLILAIPRGAVLMGKIIADALDGELDVVLVRKLGAPGNPEYAIGSMDEEGYIYLKDRIKDMVVSGGENIYPVEVENAIAHHESVADVAVIGVPDDKFGEALLAFVVLKPDRVFELEAMIEFCRERIAGYKIPRQLEIIPEMPRNPSGKILKKDLRKPYWEGIERRIG